MSGRESGSHGTKTRSSATGANDTDLRLDEEDIEDAEEAGDESAEPNESFERRGGLRGGRGVLTQSVSAGGAASGSAANALAGVYRRS